MVAWSGLPAAPVCLFPSAVETHTLRIRISLEVMTSLLLLAALQLQLPDPVGFVNDFAGVLARAQLSRWLGTSAASGASGLWARREIGRETLVSCCC